MTLPAAEAPRLPKILSGLALAAMCLFAMAGQAAAVTLKLTAQLDSSVQYDDNIYLTNTAKQSSTRYTVAPKATVSATSDQNTASLTASGNIERFSGGSGRDVNDYGVSFSDSYQASDRLTFGVNAGYSRQSLLSSELKDTGLILPGYNRRAINAGGSLGYALDETDQISLSGSFNDNRYNNALLSNYRSYQTSVGWQKRLSDRVSLTTAVSGGIENPQNTALIGRSHYVQGTVGVDYALSEVASIGANAGAYFFDQAGPLSGQVGVTAGAHASTRSEFTTVSLDVNRGLAPSGVGAFVRSTSVSLSVSERLAEHLYVDGGADIRFDKTQGSVSFALDRKYYDGTASLRWDFAHFFSFDIDYRHLRQRIVGGSLWADENRIGARLVMYSEPRE